jgi:hypothetical protein
MKRLLIVLTALAVLVPASLWAQDVPKAEVFGGFSILTIKDSGSRFTPVGWQAAVSGNVGEMFAIVGDFGGEYKDGAKFFTYMGGPRLIKRSDKADVFVHALFGSTHVNGGGGNNFTMGYGGGIDVKSSEKLSFRLIQFDWLPVKESGSGGTWQKNNLRFGFGVVLKMN